jgi:hypothetical protein
MNIAPNEPAQTGYEQQQYSDAGPTEPLIWVSAPPAVATRFARIFREARPPIFIGQAPGGRVCGEVAPNPFFLIEAHDPRVFPDHALVKHPAREHFELLLFQGYQVPVADFRDPGNGVQGDPAELPLLPQCIAKIPHTFQPIGLTRWLHRKKNAGPAKDGPAPVKERRLKICNQGDGLTISRGMTSADILNHKAALRSGQKQIAVAL